MKIIKRIISSGLMGLTALSLVACSSGENSDNSNAITRNNSSKTENNSSKSDNISLDEAYALAEEYVPTAIKNSAILEKATNYKVTDYEYNGISKYTLEDIEHYEFKFYGMWYEFDHFDNLKDDGKFYATIRVPIDGGDFYDMAYPDYS